MTEQYIVEYQKLIPKMNKQNIIQQLRCIDEKISCGASVDVLRIQVMLLTRLEMFNTLDSKN